MNDIENPNLYSVGGSSDMAKERSDRDIENEILEALDNNDDLSESDLDVVVENGVARLMGTANSPHAKTLFQDIVQNIPGVKSVENDVDVEAES